MARVRSELGHTYGIHSSLPERRFLSPFTIQSFTQVPNFARVLEVVRQVLRETAETGFTGEEVEAAREHLYGALPLQLTSPRALLSLALYALQAGLTPEDMEKDWEALREMPRDRVHAAARRLVGTGDFHLAVIGPAKELRAQLGPDAAPAVFPFKTPPEGWPD
jgi:predicted Zn-dependent peptidase